MNAGPLVLKAQSTYQQIHEYCSLSSNEHNEYLAYTNNHHVNIAKRWNELAVNK